MKGFMNWLEKSFAPKLQKFANLTWIVVVKDSLMQILPFILAGSIFCCLAIPFSDFWTPFGWTMSKISLMVAFLIPFNYCEKKKFRKQRIIAGITGLILFMIMVEPEIVADGMGGSFGQGHTAYGAGGMFVAIVAGIIAGLVFGAFNKFSFFKEDSAIPDFVRQWFDSLLPICLTVVAGWLVCDKLGIDLYTIITSILAPLGNIANTLPGMVIILTLYCFIYSMGISTWVLTPVTEPIKLTNIAANLAAVSAAAAAGTAVAASELSIFTETFIYTCYLWIGGVGCTLPLVLLMAFTAKSKEMNALGKACLIPGILNINEPVVFGAIAWNPLLMVPMWLQGIILPIMTWIATKTLAIVPIPQVQFELWYCPYPISTIISTMSKAVGSDPATGNAIYAIDASRIVVAVIFIALTFLVSTAIWYPFFKVYDKKCVADEEGTK